VESLSSKKKDPQKMKKKKKIKGTRIEKKNK
jgi:hypothetical protein